MQSFLYFEYVKENVQVMLKYVASKTESSVYSKINHLMCVQLSPCLTLTSVGLHKVTKVRKEQLTYMYGRLENVCHRLHQM